MVIDQQTDPATPFDVETKSNSSTRHGGGLLDARVRSASLQRETDFPLRHEQMHSRPDGTEAEGKERTNNDDRCTIDAGYGRQWNDHAEMIAAMAGAKREKRFGYKKS